MRYGAITALSMVALAAAGAFLIVEFLDLIGVV